MSDVVDLKKRRTQKMRKENPLVDRIMGLSDFLETLDERIEAGGGISKKESEDLMKELDWINSLDD